MKMEASWLSLELIEVLRVISTTTNAINFVMHVFLLFIFVFLFISIFLRPQLLLMLKTCQHVLK